MTTVVLFMAELGQVYLQDTVVARMNSRMLSMSRDLFLLGRSRLGGGTRWGGSQSGASVFPYISSQDAKSTDIKIYFDDKKNIPQRPDSARLSPQWPEISQEVS